MAQELIVSTADLAATIQGYVEKAEDLLGQAERAEITNAELAGNGADFLKITKGTAKRLDEWRKGLVDPYNQRIKLVNAQVKTVRTVLEKATKIVNGKVLDYQLAAQKAQEEERQRLEAEAAEAALEAAVEAEESGDPAVADQILELAGDAVTEPARAPTARGELTGASTSVRKTWTGRVDNLKHVCKAIADGHLPESLIKEISQSELNRLAREYGAQSDAEEIAQYGVVYFQKAGLSTR